MKPFLLLAFLACACDAQDDPQSYTEHYDVDCTKAYEWGYVDSGYCVDGDAFGLTTMEDQLDFTCIATYDLTPCEFGCQEYSGPDGYEYGLCNLEPVN